MTPPPRCHAPIGVPVESFTLRHFLFREANTFESVGDVIRWWETRRLGYNIIVGAVGIVSLTVMIVLGAIGPHAHKLMTPPLAIVAYGVLANVFYTLGWVTELALFRPLFGRKAPVVGATLFRYGLAFAVGMTLLPNIVSLIELAARMAGTFHR